MIQIKKNTAGRFAIELLFRPSGEDMFDSALHVAQFESFADAEAFAAKVKARLRTAPVYNVLEALDLRYWQGPKSAASGYRWDAEVEPFVVVAKA